MRTRSSRFGAAWPMLAGFAWPLVAQSVPAAPNPGAQRLQLGFFVGTWKYEGEAKPGPLGSGGRVTGTETCEWFSGHFFVVCRSEWVTGTAVSRQMGIVGYSADRQRFSFYDIDDEQGEVAQGWGVFADSTWSWEEAQPIDGRPARQRYTLREISADRFTLREEVAVNAAPWILAETGTAIREK